MTAAKPTPKRRYQIIWEAISTAKVGVKVPVRVHESAVATLIQAVSKEKSRETASKKQLGMRHAGKLVVDRGKEVDANGCIIVQFSLEWDGRRL